jgi:hypothetical protein
LPASSILLDSCDPSGRNAASGCPPFAAHALGVRFITRAFIEGIMVRQLRSLTLLELQAGIALLVIIAGVLVPAVRQLAGTLGL